MSLQDFFNEILKLNPSFASALGFHDNDHHYENPISDDYINKYKKLLLNYQQDNQDSVDYQVLKWETSMELQLLKYQFHLTPLMPFHNAIDQFEFANKNIYPAEQNDLHLNLQSRIRDFREYLKWCLIRMQQGIQKKQVISKLMCKKLIANLKSAIKNSNGYTDELQQLLSFITNKYIKHCTDGIGLIYTHPQGKQAYRFLVKYHTTLDLSPETVYNIGTAEVKRIESLIRKLMNLKKETELRDFHQTMLQKYGFNNSEELLESYKAKREQLFTSLGKYFYLENIPKYQIAEIQSQTNAGAFYHPASIAGKHRPGIFYINTLNINDSTKYEVETLSLHEGIPGHHYQHEFVKLLGLPLHRLYGSRSTAYVEGWGLYAESFVNKKDRLAYYGKLTYELFRAVRLVVDVGIHYYGWSYEKAFNYVLKHSAMSNSEIEREITRYICDPAQALAYKIGELTLLQLKKKYKNMTLKEFHKKILEFGPVPLFVLIKNLTSNT